MNPGILNRKAKSYASSPQYLCDYFRSHHSSPVLKESPQIEKLVKDSLKKFKDEKTELEKIKEQALNWKKARKKKLDKYNIKTRLENKSKVKTSRLDLDWKSSELKGWNVWDKPKSMTKNRSADRRANIGLEYFHIKSPKIMSPKPAKQEKKTQVSKKSNKNRVISFMKKKRKERIFKEKKEKSSQLENEMKRVKQLMQVEKVAKKVLKKVKTPKLRTLIPESFERVRNKVKSIHYSEDEEVIKIINEKKNNYSRPDQTQGRECVMFRNYPTYMSLKSSKLSSSSNNPQQKRAKDQQQTEPNSSMPIIELRSISRSSSSDLSEKKESLKKKIQDMKNRLRVYKDDEYPRMTLLKSQNLLEKVVFKSLCEKFHIIKYFDLEKERKSLIESSLLALSSTLSRHSSEDLEKIWDRLEVYKPTEFLQERDSFFSLTPIEDCNRNSRQTSKRPSEEIPQFLIDQLKSINSCKGSLEINEVSQEYLESSSRISETEEDSPTRISFPLKNLPLSYPLYQLEPELPEVRLSEMLIVDTSASVLDFYPGSKETSSMDSPEAEEVEEFNPKNDFLEGWSLKETQAFEEFFSFIIEDVYTQLVSEVEKELKVQQLKTIEKSKPSHQDSCVRTGVSSICKFVDRIWLHVEPVDLMLSLKFKSGPRVIGKYQGREERPPASLLSLKVFDLANGSNFESGPSYSKIHNQMIFDCVNECLASLQLQFSPPEWQKGFIPNKAVDLDTVFRLINQEIRRNCLVCAGRIANVSMITSDGVVDEVLLQRIRESSLSSMLTGEIEDIEKAWIDYEADEFCVTFELSDLILSDLFTELVEVLISTGMSQFSV